MIKPPMEKHTHPETKLLEIIRGKTGSLGRSKKWQDFLGTYKTLIMEQFQVWTSEPLEFVQGIFKALVILTALWGGWAILRFRPTQANFQGQGTKQDEDNLKTKTLPPLQYYTSIIGKRNLFRTIQPQPIRAVPVKNSPPQVHVPTLGELASDLTLVGVINSGELQAIIVSKKNQKTYYLNAGQTIGEIKIIRIQENRVTLGYNDQTLDLTM